jgi:monoamine oxidase
VTEATESADVVVVGAGLSGLTAATRLATGSRKVLVLEARDRVGGRTYTVPFDGTQIDLGGQWLGPTQDRAYALAHELGIRTFPQYLRGQRLLDVGGGGPRAYRGTIPPLRLHETADSGLTIARLELLSRLVPLEAPWRRSMFSRRWDSLTVEKWLAEAAFTDGARQMAAIAAQMILCAEPREVSFLYFLFYLRSGGGLMRLAEVQNGAQQDRIEGGAQQFSEKLAARLGDRVRLSSPVRKITQTTDGVTVEADGVTVRARRAIIAIPPALARQIQHDPELPTTRRDLETNMPMGSIVKVIVGYERAFWRERDLTGEMLSTGYPCRATFDDCQPGGGHPALVGFVVGDAARKFGKLPADQRRAAVLSQLTGIFGEEATRATAYIDHDWIADPWSTGCYVGLLGPGVLTRAGATLREPIGRIHFAGTETAMRWAGYLEGAIEAGERAANEVLASA